MAYLLVVYNKLIMEANMFITGEKKFNTVNEAKSVAEYVVARLTDLVVDKFDFGNDTSVTKNIATKNN